jgi:hydroxymethylpyrimidine pyrophosphatase-like HAD family hydrolase
LLEFLPKGASKGMALKKLKSLFPDRTIICVGDYQNDMDMLLSCDIPACPANALPEVKAISQIQLCHHSEGCIADLIYKLDSIMKK